jgi:serine/threonine-protein kinase
MSSKYIDYEGSVLDNRYRVVKRLAVGGMGSIYLGQHIVVGRKVAVKFLNRHFAERPDMAMRFFREAKAAAAIRHKNIIDIWDTGMSKLGDPFLVMEYLEGESLSDMLKRTGPIDLKAACAVLEPVLFALSAAHEKGIIHRDLKPENIFLARVQGEDLPVVKIIDFGVSKLQETGQTIVTEVGIQIGTPAYMAPEQICGEESLDHRADLYSIGVVFYKMLTGELPFTGPNNLAVFAKALTGNPLPLRQAYKDAPEEASSLVMRLLSKEAGDRPVSATAVLEELKLLPGYGERLNHLRKYTSGISEATFAAGDLSTFHQGDMDDESVSYTDVSASLTPTHRTTPTDWFLESKKSSIRRTGLLIGGTGVALLGVSIVMGTAFGYFSDGASHHTTVSLTAPKRETPASIPSPVNTKPIAPAGKAMSASDLSTQPLPIDTIQLNVNGTPKGVAITFEGKQYDTTSFEVPKSDWSATLKVTAKGYKDYELDLIPDRNRTVNVQLESVGKTDSGQKRHMTAHRKKPSSHSPASTDPSKQNNWEEFEMDF